MSDRFAGGIKAASSSISMPVVLRKTADNTELTGAVAASVTASYWRQGGARTSISPVDLVTVGDAFTSGGWKEVDSANMAGTYRFDVPDVALVTGADWVEIDLKVAGAYLFKQLIGLESRGAAELWNLLVIHAGVSQAGATSSLTLAANASSIDGTYVGSLLKITSGAGAGQSRIISAYLAATKLATVSRPWITPPDNSSVYAVLANDTVAPVNASLQGAAASVGSGVTLAAAGLDQVVIENGVNARQALAPILAACAGVVSGAATNTISIAAANNAGTNRITATVDSSGNRSAVTLSVPT
jgi:hypothetical protein